MYCAYSALCAESACTCTLNSFLPLSLWLQ